MTLSARKKLKMGASCEVLNFNVDFPCSLYFLEKNNPREELGQKIRTKTWIVYISELEQKVHQSFSNCMPVCKSLGF